MEWMNKQNRFEYLRSLLTEEEWAHLLHQSYEWNDTDTYDSEEDMIKSNFELSIPYKGFDRETHFFYKDFSFCFGEDQTYDFRKLYIDIDEMADDCGNDLSGGDFLHCRYDVDFSLYKTDGAILPYGEITRQLHVTRRDGTYRCVFQFMSEDTEVSCSSYEFATTRDFLHFMKYDEGGRDPSPIFEKLRQGGEVVVKDI